MDRQLIERYAGGSRVLHEAIEGLGIGDLVAYPVPGTWSIQQIVFHLSDSDLIGSDRMKRIIAEDRPQLIGYDETAFSQRLFYHELNIWWACDLFEKNRLLMAEILRRLPDEAFRRIGLHSERGEVTLADMVRTYVDHLERHLGFIRRKREMLGRPL